MTITAPSGAFASGFDTDCLAAPGGGALQIAFDNQDPGQLDNVAIYTDSTAATGLFTPDEGAVQGPASITYEVEPIQEAGQYFFRCNIHATTMTGTFVVA